MRYTFLQMPARNTASSTATSPPPTTATVRFLKNAPSHVAQYETPMPESFSSPGTPSLECDAPVASMTAFATKSPSAVWTIFSLAAFSTPCTSAVINETPRLSACILNLSDSSLPLSPGNPK